MWISWHLLATLTSASSDADLVNHYYLMIEYLKDVPGLEITTSNKIYFNFLLLLLRNWTVLFCIDSYDNESGRILQHFSRSTRFAFLCTAQISNFQQKLREFFGMLFEKLYKVVIFCKKFMKFAQNFTQRSDFFFQTNGRAWRPGRRLPERTSF